MERNELNKRDRTFDSVTIKNAIRENCMNDIAYLLIQVIQSHQMLPEDLVNDALFAAS